MLGFFKRLFGGSSPELAEALNAGAYLVDVRTVAEFKDGSAPGAVNIPLQSIQSNLNKFKGKKQIVLFCQSGARSGQAKRILNQNGIENVINGGSVFSVIRAMKNG